MTQGSNSAGPDERSPAAWMRRAREGLVRNRNWRWIVVLAIVLTSIPLFVLAVRTQPPSRAAPLAMTVVGQDLSTQGP